MSYNIGISKISCSLALLLGFIGMLPAASVSAAKVDLSQFCPRLDGDWVGSAAKSGSRPKQVTTAAICSSDKRNLMLTVSRGDSNPNSEVWWFRAHSGDVLLTYTDGVGADREQVFSLYQRGDSFTFLGKGQLNQRPALIRLSFEPLSSTTSAPIDNGNNDSWLWRQSAHYLDDDSQQYQLIRAIELTTVQPN